MAGWPFAVQVFVTRFEVRVDLMTWDSGERLYGWSLGWGILQDAAMGKIIFVGTPACFEVCQDWLCFVVVTCWEASG